MTDARLSTQSKGAWRDWALRIALWAAGITTTLLLVFKGDVSALVAYFAGAAAGPWQPHAPDVARLAQAGPAVLIHLATLAAAMVVGAVLLAGVKGTAKHRVLGTGWVACMLVSAISTFFIRPGAFSVLHAFSIGVVIAAPLALSFARQHRVRLHRRMMISLYFSQLWLVGLFAFLPGRLLHDIFFG